MNTSPAIFSDGKRRELKLEGGHTVGEYPYVKTQDESSSASLPKALEVGCTIIQYVNNTYIVY